MELEATKIRLTEEVDRRAGELTALARDLHANPELGYHETFAHGRACDLLVGEGLDVDRSPCGLETAFVARAGSGRPTAAVLCEYDALPEIGHACGHNIIAAAGLGAGLAAAAVAEEGEGSILVVGTPAEEGGGGKLPLLDGGVLDDVDAAMMVHPAGLELTAMTTLAVDQVRVVYEGRAAHAAAAPQDGRNALDAAVLGYMNVAALRQHIAPDERIHGVFTAGGDKPNIVPARTEMVWYVRSPTTRSLEPLRARFTAALEAGASAAGCEITFDWHGPLYADMVDSEPLLEAYAANARRLDRDPAPPTPGREVVGSTDMGNVSYRVPSIHPMIKVAADDVAIHTAAFAEAAASEAADRAVLDGAKALGMTVLDVWGRPDLVPAARASFDSALQRHG